MHLIAPTGYRVAPRTPIVRCYVEWLFCRICSFWGQKRMRNTFSGGDALRNAWGETPGAVPWPLSYIPRTDFTIEKGYLVTISYSKSGGYALKWLRATCCTQNFFKKNRARFEKYHEGCSFLSYPKCTGCMFQK